MLLHGVIHVENSANNGEALAFVLCYNMGVGNTVGRRINIPQESDWAYIAGFFDGDGSLMVQLKNRRDTKRGWRIMVTLSFYQDTRHRKPLQWMQEVLGIGYIHDRNDGITELKVNGYSRVRSILQHMQPYVRFKSYQVKKALKILTILEDKEFLSLSRQTRRQLADCYNALRNANYAAHRRKFSDEQVKELLTR